MNLPPFDDDSPIYDEWDNPDRWEAIEELPTYQEDPEVIIRQRVENILGFTFDEIIINSESGNPANRRGNRYSSVVDAIVDLYSSGIISFSNVVIEDDEATIEVGESNNGR